MHKLLIPMMVLSMAASTCFAQGKIEKLGPHVRDIANRAKTIVEQDQQRFLSVGDPREKSIIKSVKIDVDTENFDIYGTHSDAKDGRIIHIPIGFILATDYLDRMIIDSIDGDLPANTESYDVYQKYLSQKFDESDENVKKGEQAPIILHYCEFLIEEKLLKETKARCEQIRVKQYQATQFVKINSIGFTVAHELGHFVLSHVEPKSAVDWAKTPKQMETEADQYAFDKMIRVRMNPIWGQGSIGLFSSMVPNDLPGRQQADTIRPNPDCRVARIYLAGVRFWRKYGGISQSRLSAIESVAQKGQMRTVMNSRVICFSIRLMPRKSRIL